MSSGANFCVVLSGDFANVKEFVFFARERAAKSYARKNGGIVVDEQGLAEVHEDMHCAEGRDYHQTYSGRHLELPYEDTDREEYAESFWQDEYADVARKAFENAEAV